MRGECPRSVGDRARVDIALADEVARRAGQRLTGIEAVIGVADAGERGTGDTGPIVGDGERTIKGNVAAIREDVGVVDQLSGSAVGGHARALVEDQARAGRPR